MSARRTGALFWGDNGQGARRITRKMLEASGTLLWRRELDDGSVLEHYDYAGGRLLYARFDGYYTVDAMTQKQAKALQRNPKALRRTVAKMASDVARNREDAIDRNQFELARKESSQEFLAEIAGGRTAYSADFSDKVITRMMLRRDLADALKALSPTMRSDWCDHVLLGMSMSEVAHTRGVSRQAVRMSVMAAGKAIRKHLADAGWGPDADE